jgi:hypothetical protein
MSPIRAEKGTIPCADCRGYVIRCQQVNLMGIFQSWLHLINAIFKLAVNKTFFFLSLMVKLRRNRIGIEFYEKNLRLYFTRQTNIQN